jgi:hypothetical protein
MKHSVRNWHNWVSVALGIPLLLVGLTTFFIAHEKRLGTKDVILPFGGAANEPVDIRATAIVGGAHWLGTRYGVFKVEQGKAVALPGAPDDEIRAMIVAGDAVLMAGKRALWRYAGGKATVVHRADCWDVATHADGYAATCKDIGVLLSANGTAWQPLSVAFPAMAAMREDKGTPLSKVIMDMHTGKFFFGKEYEWIWIDLLGIACVLLGLTGLLMWMRGRRQRAGMSADA